jgi:Reverse transcriptase (RNA-dependent DNA polymerase)
VKYDLRHKVRLVARGHWRVNDKEDIYSGVVRMDTVRIGFFLGLSCCLCDIGNAFLYGKTKEKVYITAGPEFGAALCGKNLIINKSLYGLKTSAARLHEHLAI